MSGLLEFCEKHFAALILLYCTHTCLLLITIFVWKNVDDKYWMFAAGAYTTFQGALVGVLVPTRSTLRKDDNPVPNGNGKGVSPSAP